jgi:glycosyltransferase involved in cell wall biosynthesis
MKKGIIIVGKIPPPFFGPAVATKIILDSNLSNDFDLKHVDTRMNRDISTMGKFSVNKFFLLFRIYFQYFKFIINRNNKVVLIPIAQQSSALYKDAVFMIFAILFRKKYILHLRGSALLIWYENTSKFNQKVFRHFFSKASTAIVLGENLKYIFEDFLQKDKIVVVPNGANFSFPQKTVINDKIKLLYFANLMKNKGLDILLEAMVILSQEEKSKFSCEVAGSWENKEFENECKKIVDENELDVFFKPALSGDEKFSCFSKADIFIFTPRAPEGHPWVIVEAMAAGLPIISSNQGAIIESVIDGENGFIVSTDNPKDLANKLKYFLESKEMIVKMGSKSKEMYQEKFTEEVMISSLKAIFTKMIK